MSSIFNTDSDYDSTDSQLSDICPIDPKDNYILFIGEERYTQLMVKAFQICHTDDSVNARWIQSTDLLNWRPFSQQLFVLNSFNSNSFIYLCERKARIVGPLLIIEAYVNQTIMNLITSDCLKFGPVMNSCMKESFVCIRIKDRNRRRHLIQLVQYMSGVYCRRLTSIVTHLIIDSVQTESYQKALNYGLPVVTEEWVHKCWRDSQYMTFSANDETIVAKLLVPHFKRVSINQFVINEAKSRFQTDDIRPKEDTESMAQNDIIKDNVFNDLQWLEFESQSTQSNNDCHENSIQSEDNKNEELGQTMDDGLDWIDCDSDTKSVPLDMDQPIEQIDDLSPNQNNGHQLEDTSDQNAGLDWIQFDPTIDSKQMMPIEVLNRDISNTSDEDNQQIRLKRTKTENTDSVVWDFKEFEGMPSQRPYLRI